MLRFALLGAVAVGEDVDELVAQPAGIPTTVLSVLLLNANQVVPRERLVAAIWGEDPPTAAAAGLCNHVSRLRRQLGTRAGARVQTVAPGYRIEVQDGELDVQRFLDDAARGRQALAEGDLVSAHRLLSDALALWRGEPLGDLPSTPELTARVHGWQENRLSAVEGRIEADLGRSPHLLPRPRQHRTHGSGPPRRPHLRGGSGGRVPAVSWVHYPRVARNGARNH